MQLKHHSRAQTLTSWVQTSPSTLINIFLPTFDIKTSLQLAQPLNNMGLTLPFSTKANFSNFSNSPSALRISDVYQSTHIIVNEKGTKAAAATAVVMIGSVMIENPPKPILVNVNHPFIFMLYDNKTQTILFMGQVLNPKA